MERKQRKQKEPKYCTVIKEASSKEGCFSSVLIAVYLVYVAGGHTRVFFFNPF